MIFKLQKIKTRRKFLKEGRGKKKFYTLYTGLLFRNHGSKKKFCRFVQPLWRTVWRFLKKLEIELPYILKETALNKE